LDTEEADERMIKADKDQMQAFTDGLNTIKDISALSGPYPI